MRKALFILGSLSDEDVEWMIEAGEKRVASSGDEIIVKGNDIQHLFIITDGEMVVVNPDAGNSEIARLKAGEIVGEMSLIESSPPSASVICKSDAVLLAIPRSELNKKIESDPGFGSRFYYAIAVFLSDRLRKTVSTLGYGEFTEEEEKSDEIDFNVMENLHLAGARFDSIMKKLSEI